ncbi:MAG: IS110 family transposase [Clostridia bacterium]|nr:IS110 family transposase [Clostridia bacterium]
MNNILSVGIDVGADFSYMSIVLPNHQFIGKPFKIIHNSTDSLLKAFSIIKNVESDHPNFVTRILVESTSIYHFPLLYYFKEKGFKVDVVNPLITNSNSNFNIRKVHSDKIDSKKISILGLNPKLKISIIPDDFVLDIRNLTREYYRLISNRTTLLNKLNIQLRQSFPQFIGIFSKITSKSSFMILTDYTTPDNIISQDRDVLIEKINKHSRIGINKATKKYELLIKACHDAKSFGHFLSSNEYLIKMFISRIQSFDNEINAILDEITKLVISHENSRFVKQVKIIESIPGAGFISSVALMCEIGDFSAFKKPKQLYAYFGLDPAVKQSGNFNATNVKISKRGSRLARRIIFTIALHSISKTRNGKSLNSVLREYYLEKCKSKSKMTSLGAIMHKVCNILYAILRDNKPFVLTSTEEHCKKYKKSMLSSAA